MRPSLFKHGKPKLENVKRGGPHITESSAEPDARLSLPVYTLGEAGRGPKCRSVAGSSPSVQLPMPLLPQQTDTVRRISRQILPVKAPSEHSIFRISFYDTM